ncbi:helix-turn-helix domain-containing protein [Agromyces sp. SYSU T0242]|uniref:helix-turn-helix domain-containing protein n=1 Tax=Agromyces litoreus TaxID=3158561 RepID=UPI0033974763
MGQAIGFTGGRVEAMRRSRPLWRDVLGDVLRDERRGQERILTEVARTAGVSPQYLSEVERGRKEASSEVLGAVADALGLELADVVGRVAGRLAPPAPDRAEPGRRAPVARVRPMPAAPLAPVAPAPSDALLLAA